MSASTTASPGGLEAVGLSVTFGGLRAVDDVSITVRRGELVGLIGPNGAGKTSTIDALTGFVRHGGRVIFDGADLTAAPPHRRARAGLARTWQSLELFDDLTVEENGLVAASPGGTEKRDAARQVDQALDLLGLRELATRYPSELPLGQQKLVGVARALSAAPGVVLLDEPAAGLDTDESRELGERLRALTERGVGLLLVDHDMGLVLGVCDRVHVLDFGRMIATGTPAEVRDDERVIAAYLGAQA